MVVPVMVGGWVVLVVRRVDRAQVVAGVHLVEVVVVVVVEGGCPGHLSPVPLLPVVKHWVVLGRGREIKL